VNDPHVKELVYHIENGDGLHFQDPPPIGDETDAFDMTLEEGVVTFSMKEHHPTEQSARQAVEGYLRAWELDVALQYGRSELHFVFDRSGIVDRDPLPPPPPGTKRVVELSGTVMGRSSARATLQVLKTKYPQPPSDFVADTDARTMWEQYERYKQDRDRLLPMAYSCLARLEHRARNHPAKGNKRMKTAGMYRVDCGILDTLGRLATTLGDETEARKLSPQSQLRAPTAQEIKWMEAALRLLIRRTGQYAADPQRDWPQLTMADLPELA
jgi:hypothetical protein